MHELNRKYLAERPNLQKRCQDLMKAIANLPLEEKQRKTFEMWTKIHQEARPVRRQVEALLTPAQLAKLRMLALVDRYSAALLVYNLNDPQARWRLTEEQKKEIEQLCGLEQKFQMEAYEKIVQCNMKTMKKRLPSSPRRSASSLSATFSKASPACPLSLDNNFLSISPPRPASATFTIRHCGSSKRSWD